MSSWSSDIANYRREKHYGVNTINSNAESVTVPRPRLARTSQDTRDFDIITGSTKPEAILTRSKRVVRDAPSTEEAIARATSAQRVGKALSHSYHAFDIVNHKPAYGMSPQEANGRFPADRHRGVRSIGEYAPKTFDLVSNTALYGREAEFEAEEKARLVHHPRFPPRQRQTDIVSHEFLVNHEERFARQQEANKKLLESRKKPTDFNPVLQTWNDSSVEAKAQANKLRKDEDLRDAVKNHTYKVSSLVRHSEGHAVDFLTGTVHNPEFLLEIEKHRARGMLQRTMLRQEFDHRRDMEEAVRDVDANLVLNRRHASKRPEICGGEKVPSTLARLEASMQTKPAVQTSVYLAEGPRTSHERVLNVKPSEVAAAANTFEGRRKLILPTLEKAAGRPLRREELISVLRK